MLESTYNALAVPDQNRFIAVLDGKRCRTIDAFYVQANAALHLPDYFGGNLDALYDCLCDFEWLTQQHVQLFITRSELLLSVSTPDERTALLDTLRDAEANQCDGRTFEVILLGHDKA